MEKIDIDKTDPKKLVAAVLKDKEPRLIIAKGQECSILLPYNPSLKDLLAAHPRNLQGDMADAEKDPAAIGMGSIQIFVTKEQDAMIYLDKAGKPKLVLVGIERFKTFSAR